MLTDLRAAQLCVDLYAGRRASFSIIDFGEDDGICWAISQEPDSDVIVLRGSVTIQDWMRNLMALTLPYSSRRMGPVHPGFYLGMDNALEDMFPMLRRDLPVHITGHSLGAARAALLCAMMMDTAISPASCVMFGSPKPGFAQLGKLIEGIPIRSYHNKHDAITTLPFTFPPEDYVHPVLPIQIEVDPLPGDHWGMFAYHHMELYMKALELKEKTDAA